MESLTTYYTTLLVIQITVFGIGFAGLIALIQILRPLLSHKSTQRLINNRLMICTGLLVLASILLTATATLLLTLKRYDFIGWQLHSMPILSSNEFALINMFFMFLSIGSAIFILLRYSKYLIPTNAIEFLRRNTRPDDLKQYFEDKYLEKPMPVFTFAFNRPDPNVAEKTEEELQKEYDKKLKDYEIRKSRVKEVENPLLPMENYLMQAVRKDDLQATQSALETFESIVFAVIESKANISADVIRYVTVVYSNVFELAETHGMQSISLSTLDTMEKLSLKLIESKKFYEVNPLLDLWRTTADKNLSSQPMIYIKIMNSYRYVGEACPEHLRDEKAKNLLDNVDRCLGWLGERMLTKGEPERSMMMQMDYETEFNALYNAVYGVGDAIERHAPDFYPLIHFDCLYVIAKSLAPYCSENDNESDNSNSLFSLMYGLKTFAERAIDHKNVSGASLALLRLKEQYQIAKDNKLSKQMNHCLIEIMDIGAYAAGRKLKGTAQFMHEKSLADAAIKILSERALPGELDHEAMEIIIKQPPSSDSDEIDKYLRSLGKALNTTFGLNLDRE